MQPENQRPPRKVEVEACVGHVVGGYYGHCYAARTTTDAGVPVATMRSITAEHALGELVANYPHLFGVEVAWPASAAQPKPCAAVHTRD